MGIVLLLERFGKDEYGVFIRKLFRIWQTSLVSEYVEHFMTLVDNLVAYGHHTDPLYFVQRFMDGLREDIRATVIVRRLLSLDSACVLALLQEEVVTLARRLDTRRSELGWSGKSPSKGSFTLPMPPQGDKLAPSGGVGKTLEPTHPRAVEDKLVAFLSALH